MAIIGGRLGYRMLRRIAANGHSGLMNGSAYAGRSKLEALLGPGIWTRIRDRVVIDFGCGSGAEAVEMALRGARKVIGVEILPHELRAARERAERSGVADRCVFTARPAARAHVIVALDSFEHFADPGGVLRTMAEMLEPGGQVLACFGPTWYHPLGGHLLSPFPWAHLLFTEKALMRWRSDFRADGATRLADVEGGLNRMTIRRFRSLVADSPFTMAQFEAVPIRRLAAIANPVTREFTTATVRCTLVLREGAGRPAPAPLARAG